VFGFDGGDIKVFPDAELLVFGFLFGGFERCGTACDYAGLPSLRIIFI
jgi:hypothetical protein